MARKLFFFTAPGIAAQAARTFAPPGIIASQIARSVGGVDFVLEPADYTSYLGVPIHTQIEFPAGKYIDIEGNEQVYDGIILQTVLAEVTQTKNIVKTVIQGRNGSVKEYISDGDFIITLTGAVIGETIWDNIDPDNPTASKGHIADLKGYTPTRDTKFLIDICKIPQAITITSEFLQLFGINDVVIENYGFAEREGTRDMQPFQITMSSDVSIDLNELESTRIIEKTVRISSEPIIVLSKTVLVTAEPIILVG